MFRTITQTCLLIAVLMLMSACATQSSKPQASLYDRLGGQESH